MLYISHMLFFAQPTEGDLLKHDRNWFSCMHICISTEHLCMNAREGVQHRRSPWVTNVIHHPLSLHPLNTLLARNSMTIFTGYGELKMSSHNHMNVKYAQCVGILWCNIHILIDKHAEIYMYAGINKTFNCHTKSVDFQLLTRSCMTSEGAPTQIGSLHKALKEPLIKVHISSF